MNISLEIENYLPLDICSVNPKNRKVNCMNGLIQDENNNKPDDSVILLEATTEIVSAYVGHNAVSSNELPTLVETVHATLSALVGGDAKPHKTRVKPAVPIKQSLHDDYIICLEDGKKFKALKRHLRSYYDLSPEEYREKWGLPPDYPMVTVNYAKKRSQLAREFGLGRKLGTKVKKRSL